MQKGNKNYKIVIRPRVGYTVKTIRLNMWRREAVGKNHQWSKEYSKRLGSRAQKQTKEVETDKSIKSYSHTYLLKWSENIKVYSQAFSD